MNPTIIENNKKIAALQKKRNALDSQISKLCNINSKIRNGEDALVVKKIPGLKKLSQKDVDYILYHYHGITDTHYKFSKEFVQKHCWALAMGFMEDTRQHIFMLSKYTFEAPEYDEKTFFDFYEYVVCRAKKTKATDRGGITEIGVPIYILELEDDVTSVAYVDGTVHLHTDRWSDPKAFKNFKEFINWLKTFYQVRGDATT